MVLERDDPANSGEIKIALPVTAKIQDEGEYWNEEENRKSHRSTAVPAAAICSSDRVT